MIGLPAALDFEHLDGLHGSYLNQWDVNSTIDFNTLLMIMFTLICAFFARKTAQSTEKFEFFTFRCNNRTFAFWQHGKDLCCPQAPVQPVFNLVPRKYDESCGYQSLVASSTTLPRQLVWLSITAIIFDRMTNLTLRSTVSGHWIERKRKIIFYEHHLAPFIFQKGYCNLKNCIYLPWKDCFKPSTFLAIQWTAAVPNELLARLV